MGQRGIFWKQEDRNTAKHEMKVVYKARIIFLDVSPKQTDIHQKVQILLHLRKHFCSYFYRQNHLEAWTELKFN